MTPPKLVCILSDVNDVSGAYNLEFEVWENLSYFMVWVNISEEFGEYPDIKYPYVNLTIDIDEWITPLDNSLMIEVWMEDTDTTS